MNFYDLTFTNNKGKETSMAEYKDKVVLVVNTASKCGFTPQYEGLEKLNKEYKDKGLVILGFPCNQFGSQEPGSESDIESFCQVNYGVSFTLSKKIDVNGDDAHPVFHYLKEQAPGLLGSKAIKWNFTKFLIDKNGEVLERFAPTTKPEELEEQIKKLLA